MKDKYIYYIALGEFIAMFIAALVGMGVLGIENRMILSFLIATLIFLVNYGIDRLYYKIEKRKGITVYHLTYPLDPPSKEWKKQSRNFLIEQIVFWAILIVDYFTSYKNESAILAIISIHWLLFSGSFRHEYEISEKEFSLYFCVMPIIYASWFAAFMAESIFFHP